MKLGQYKIYGVMLYDNQLNHDLLVFTNKRNQPYFLKDEYDYNKKILQKYYDDVDIVVGNGNDYIILNKIEHYRVSYSIGKPQSYDGYDIIWDEGKSGINASDFLYVHKYHKNEYSIYRIWEYYNEIKKSRVIFERYKKIKKILI